MPRVYRMVKIGPLVGDTANDYHAGQVGFVPVDADTKEPTVPVYLSMSCPMGFEPDRLEDKTA